MAKPQEVRQDDVWKQEEVGDPLSQQHTNPGEQPM